MSRGLPGSVKQCLQKSTDSALLAVEVYNKPATKFKSGGYIILMVIAWTSLFHAIFFKRRLKPFHRKKNSIRFEKRDGDYVYWELKECVNQYFQSDTSNPVRKNLEFFIPIRNIIEHKSLPQIDADLFAECQAMLLNFDKILEKEFGDKYCLKESLSFSLQLFPSEKKVETSLDTVKDAKKVMSFVDKYRSSLSPDVYESGQYSFKAFLLQVANHKSKDALPIQFVKWDSLSDEEKKRVKKTVALVRYKEKPVYNADLFKPFKVVEMVQKGLGNPKIKKNGKDKDIFHMGVHTNCWKFYKVRPGSKADKPDETKIEFCIYDKLNNSYGYTKKWIDFLVEKLSDKDEFERVIQYREQ